MWWGYVVTALGTLAAAYLAYWLGLRRDRDMDRAKRTADAFAQFVRATVDAQAADGLAKKARRESRPIDARYWEEQYKSAFNSAAQARTLMLTFGQQAVVDALVSGFVRTKYDPNDPDTADAMRQVAEHVRGDLGADAIAGHPAEEIAAFLVQPNPRDLDADTTPDAGLSGPSQTDVDGLAGGPAPQA